MKALGIAVKDLQVLIRDKRALLILIAMPFLLISILGLALGDVFSKTASVPKYDVAVVDYDHSQLSKEFTNGLLRSKDVKNLLNVSDTTEADARTTISQGEMAAAIVIPKGFGTTLLSGHNSTIKILADPGQPLRVQIVQAITQSFAGHVSFIFVAVKTPLTQLLASGAVTQPEAAQLQQQLSAQAQKASEKPLIQVTQKDTAAAKELSAVQYYSAGMGVMFILFGSMFGAFSLLDERRNLTLARLFTTPTGRTSILGGKLGGIFLIGILQFATLVLATRIIFKVEWGALAGVILLMMGTVMAATGMAIFIAAVAKTNKSAAAMSQMMIQGMAALGGSMIPITVFPAWMQTVSKFTINYWAIFGFTQLMSGKGLAVITTPVLVLLVVAVTFMALGVWRFKYE